MPSRSYWAGDSLDDDDTHQDARRFSLAAAHVHARVGSLPTPPGRPSESQVRDADAENLGEPAAVEGARHRIARLPRLDRAYGSSHLLGQPNLRPLARIPS